MTEIIDVLVFAVVIAARFGIPLAIPKYPLPAIITAMILDAVDQTIFQIFTTRELEGYQSYDKALDIYYLAIAYVSTLRNWTNLFAFQAGQFLWYYRLVGVTAFELIGWRPLLLIFPNVFEYFFILYSAVALRWNPGRLTRNMVLTATAVLWIGVKLPQEYWIHIAQLDTTDLIKERILGVSADTGWVEAIAENLWVVPVVLVVAAGAVALARWVTHRLPPAEWSIPFGTRVDVDAFIDQSRPVERQPRGWLIEKIALVGLITVIFAQMLPGLEASVLQIIGGVSVVVILNSLVSYLLAVRGTHWRSVLTEFLSIAAVNLAISTLYVILLPVGNGDVGFFQLVFLTLLLTLIVTLYDHYRLIHDQRVELVLGAYRGGRGRSAYPAVGAVKRQ